MTSAPMRDPLADHLLTPQNAAPRSATTSPPSRPESTRWTPRAAGQERRLDRQHHQDLRSPGRAHDTNVATGRGQPTLPQLADLLTDDKPLDQTTTNSCEDIEFLQAVHATGRAFPHVDLDRQGKARRSGKPSPRYGSGCPRAGAAPVADGGHRLLEVEPGAGGEHLVEAVRPQRLAELSDQLGLPPPPRWPHPQADPPP